MPASDVRRALLMCPACPTRGRVLPCVSRIPACCFWILGAGDLGRWPLAGGGRPAGFAREKAKRGERRLGPGGPAPGLSSVGHCGTVNPVEFRRGNGGTNADWLGATSGTAGARPRWQRASCSRHRTTHLARTARRCAADATHGPRRGHGWRALAPATKQTPGASAPKAKRRGSRWGRCAWRCGLWTGLWEAGVRGGVAGGGPSPGGGGGHRGGKRVPHRHALRWYWCTRKIGMRSTFLNPQVLPSVIPWSQFSCPEKAGPSDTVSRLFCRSVCLAQKPPAHERPAPRTRSPRGTRTFGNRPDLRRTATRQARP